MNLKDVENLAELAKLEMSGEEKQEILKDMEGILGYVNMVERVEVPTRVGIPTKVGIENMNVYNAWREDKEEPREFSKEIIAEEFPDSKDGFLKVKKIL